jgi:phosphoribosyl-AMP cyclohydrolase
MEFRPGLWLSCNNGNRLDRRPACAGQREKATRPGLDHWKDLRVNSSPLSKQELEKGTHFLPKFDAAGLLPAVIVDAEGESVLMLGWMNAEALAQTRETGRVHFWSRSRKSLWMKGETSGNVLEVEEILVDCDQDTLLVRARPHGPTCHTGARSCFYRRLDPSSPDIDALSEVSR